ncbi:MAG: TAXI family TRAP transporter solute-binding subunit [Pseudomonadota bacterium]
MKFAKRVAAAAMVASAFCALAPAALTQEQFFSIGTGGVTGVYYPTGGAICRLVNQGRLQHGIRCFVEPTDGSVDNIEALREGRFEFGVVQSDWQFHALSGSSKFSTDGPFSDLRAVFSIHPEPFTVVVRAESEVQSFEELVDKRVNIGAPGSGMRGIVQVLVNQLSMEIEDFAAAAELPPADQPQALCDGQIDAMVYTVGHPSAAVIEATTRCDARIIDVPQGAVETLIETNNDYRAAVIPGGMYNGTDDDIDTFGVIATLVTTASVPDEIVYTLVQSVFDNFSSFTRLHPAFNSLTEEAMISDALSAPLHPGAERYYRERGWVE